MMKQIFWNFGYIWFMIYPNGDGSKTSGQHQMAGRSGCEFPANSYTYHRVLPHWSIRILVTWSRHMNHCRRPPGNHSNSWAIGHASPMRKHTKHAQWQFPRFSCSQAPFVCIFHIFWSLALPDLASHRITDCIRSMTSHQLAWLDHCPWFVGFGQFLRSS